MLAGNCQFSSTNRGVRVLLAPAVACTTTPSARGCCFKALVVQKRNIVSVGVVMVGLGNL